MIKLVLFVIACSAISTGFAQDKFLPAFYIDQQNDTVQGFIQAKENYNSQLKFRTQLKSSSQQLSVREVKYFGFIEGPHYKRIYLSKNDSTNLFFAKTLIEGSVDLLFYQGQFLLFSEQKGMFRLAKGGVSNDKEALGNYQKNVGYFNILFFDCPTVKQEAAKTRIRQDQLIQLVENYHECKGLQYHNNSQPQKKLRQLRFFAGISSSNLSFGGTKFYLKISEFESSVKPSFGVILLSQPAKPSSVFSTQTELQYSSGEFNSTATYENEVQGFQINQTSISNIKYSRLTLKYGCRITARSNKINPFISAGLSVSQSLSSYSKANHTLQINESVETSEEEIISSAGGIGTWIAIGIKKRISKTRAFSLDINYEHNTLPEGGRLVVVSPRITYVF